MRPCSPGSHPHSDRPNWRPAETLEAYLSNCREGLEEYSDRRVAKIMGWSRIQVWRARMMAEIPNELFDLLLDQHAITGSKALGNIGRVFAGKAAPAETERCPHCGGVIRVRSSVPKKIAAIVNNWLKAKTKAAERMGEGNCA